MDTISFIPYTEANKNQELVNCGYNESEVYIIKSEEYNVIYYFKFNKNKIWSCSPIIKDNSIVGWDEW
jgi:hypothetical protein